MGASIPEVPRSGTFFELHDALVRSPLTVSAIVAGKGAYSFEVQSEPQQFEPVRVSGDESEVAVQVERANFRAFMDGKYFAPSLELITDLIGGYFLHGPKVIRRRRFFRTKEDLLIIGRSGTSYVVWGAGAAGGVVVLGPARTGGAGGQ